MSLKTDVVQSLLQFASAGGGPFTLDVQGTNGRLAAQVTAVDREERRIDFRLVEAQRPKPGARKRRGGASD